MGCDARVWEQRARAKGRDADVPPPRVFWQKSVEVADSNADKFFGNDKELAIV
jgi:hypothetical protein